MDCNSSRQHRRSAMHSIPARQSLNSQIQIIAIHNSFPVHTRRRTVLMTSHLSVLYRIICSVAAHSCVLSQTRSECPTNAVCYRASANTFQFSPSSLAWLFHGATCQSPRIECSHGIHRRRPASKQVCES